MMDDDRDDEEPMPETGRKCKLEEGSELRQDGKENTTSIHRPKGRRANGNTKGDGANILLPNMMTMSARDGYELS